MMNKKIFSLVLILLISLISPLNCVVVNAEGWWNSDWSERAPIQINNIGSALTDYQIMINLTYNSSIQSNFGDIRFVNNSSNTEIPYWIENKTDSSYANIWFNVPSIPASSWLNDTIYLYYNNSNVSTTSNGNTTFELFDDFSDHQSVSQMNYISRTDSAYLYKDMGVDYFDDFEINITTMSQQYSGNGVVGVFGLSNTINDFSNFGSNDLSVYWYSSAPFIRIARGPNLCYSDYTLDGYKEYFLTIRRTAGNDSIYLDIYSDSGRTNLLSSINCSGYGTTKYQYIYGASSWNSGSGLSSGSSVIELNGQTENFSTYTEVDPGGDIYINTYDRSKWWGELGNITTNTSDNTIRVQEGVELLNYHSSLISHESFMSGVATWKITEAEPENAPALNTGVCDPSIQVASAGRDIYYWQTAGGIGNNSYARFRINGPDIFTSAQESHAPTGRISVHFIEGFASLIKDGLIKLNNTSASLTIPNGMKPFIGISRNGGNEYIIADWVFVRQYASSEPNIILGDEESSQANPPEISNITSWPTSTNCPILWDVNQTTNNRIEYGLTSSLGSWSTWDNATNSTEIIIYGLTDNTTYYFSAWSHNLNESSISTNSSIYNFTTGSIPYITSWLNNKTNDQNLTIYANLADQIHFNVTADQNITAWTWNVDGTNYSQGFDNITLSFNTETLYELSAYGTNENGTTNVITWVIIIGDIQILIYRQNEIIIEEERMIGLSLLLTVLILVGIVFFLLGILSPNSILTLLGSITFFITMILPIPILENYSYFGIALSLILLLFGLIGIIITFYQWFTLYTETNSFRQWNDDF